MQVHLQRRSDDSQTTWSDDSRGGHRNTPDPVSIPRGSSGSSKQPAEKAAPTKIMIEKAGCTTMRCSGAFFLPVGAYRSYPSRAALTLRVAALEFEHTPWPSSGLIAHAVPGYLGALFGGMIGPCLRFCVGTWTVRTADGRRSLPYATLTPGGTYC